SVERTPAGRRLGGPATAGVAAAERGELHVEVADAVDRAARDLGPVQVQALLVTRADENGVVPLVVVHGQARYELTRGVEAAPQLPGRVHVERRDRGRRRGGRVERLVGLADQDVARDRRLEPQREAQLGGGVQRG